MTGKALRVRAAWRWTYGRRPHSWVRQGIRLRRWPISISCTCTCTRPIRCWKARSPIARLAELAKADKQAALALTDTDNMFGALEFSEKLSRRRHPADRRLRAGRRFRRHRPRRRATATCRPARERIVLLAAREAGYRSLMRLSLARLPRHAAERAAAAQARMAGGRDRRHHRAHRRARAGRSMRAIAAGQSHLATTRLDALHRLFGDRLYVELQRHGTRRRAHGRAGADRTRLRQGHSAGRHQRAVFRRRATTTKRTTR